MSAQRRGPVVVGVVVAALVAGPVWASQGRPEAARLGAPMNSTLAVKKKVPKGTLAIAVSGSGSYTVNGKNFRKTGNASKSFKVKPGTYMVKAPAGSVKPSRVKIRKGKTVRVSVTFAPTATPSNPPSPVPSPTVTDTPAPTPPPTPTPSPTLPPNASGPIQRLSVDATGLQGNSDSEYAAWSPDGTQVAFESWADNLVAGDTNNYPDVFVKTLATGAIQRISTNSSALQADGQSACAVWSPDGTQVAFRSEATNLVGADSNTAADIFVKTLATGSIQRISTDSIGTQSNSSSSCPAWSPDGGRIAFASNASNLVSGDTNGNQDIFVKTLATGSVERISTDAASAQANAASYDPQWSPDSTRIVFDSYASNLVPGDTNSNSKEDDDIFVKTLATGAIQRINTDSAGMQADGSSYSQVWSPDGASIAFSSDATNLVPGDTNNHTDVFVKTLATGAIQRISTDASGTQANGDTYAPAWSPDSARVAFRAEGSNLVPADTNNSTDVLVKTLANGAVQRVSTDASGAQANGSSYDPAWAPDGNHVAFHSNASNLLPDDTNGVADVFVKTLG